LGSSIWSSNQGIGVWGLQFEVWDLGLGIRDLGFLGFRKS